MKSPRTEMLHVRIPQRLMGKLKALASQRSVAISNLVREMLEYEAANPALLPRPGELVAGQIRLLAKRLGMKPADLIHSWIEEKLSEEAFEEDGLETDRAFSLEERFDLLTQKHEALADEIRKTRSALLAASYDSRQPAPAVKRRPKKDRAQKGR
jgi:hypothetical protein